jgi:hypothetical protein
VTPEQEAQVRRALAAVARAEDGPESRVMPQDVVDRLDDVLSELVADRAGRAGSTTTAGPPSDAPAEQDELASHRHRRWPNVLVAAAAVAVIAAAGGAVATRGFGGGGAESGSAASSADRVASESAGIAAPTPASPSGSPPATSLRGSGKTAGVLVPALSSRTLARDVRRVVAAGPKAYLAPQGTTRDLPALPRPDGALCGRPDAPGGADLVAVRLDGKPATLLLGPVKNGVRVARVYSCDQPPVVVAATPVPAAG